jgi:hypothetical protein
MANAYRNKPPYDMYLPGESLPKERLTVLLEGLHEQIEALRRRRMGSVCEEALPLSVQLFGHAPLIFHGPTRRGPLLNQLFIEEAPLTQDEAQNERNPAQASMHANIAKVCIVAFGNINMVSRVRTASAFCARTFIG